MSMSYRVIRYDSAWPRKPVFVDISALQITDLPNYYATFAQGQKAETAVQPGALASVATTGAYSDLSGKPTIPSAQVNSDWNSASGLSQILNKPTLGTAASQNSSAFATSAQGTKADSAVQPAGLSGYLQSSGSYADPSWLTSLGWGKVSSTPTTLAGYGISDAYPSSNPSAFVSTSGARSALSITTSGTSGASTYNSTTGVLNVPQYANSGGAVTSVAASSSDITVGGSPITSSGTLTFALPSVGTPGTYSGVTTDAKGRVSAGTTRSFSAPTFSGITTAAQISTTRDAEVMYDIDATVNISLLAGQSVTATLKYADNSGMSTNPVTVSSQTAQNSGVLGLTQTNTLKLSGQIPAGKYRQVTFAGTGSPTLPTTLKAGQEVLL